MRRRTSFLSRPPRWKKRILYFLAFLGALALSGLAFILYLSLQVPEDQLPTGIPFPKLASTIEKTEPIPDVTKSAPKKSPVLSDVSSYAFLYATKSPGEGQSKPRALRSRNNRAKSLKRAPGSVKTK